jgi:hypothetical protein
MEREKGPKREKIGTKIVKSSFTYPRLTAENSS